MCEDLHYIVYDKDITYRFYIHNPEDPKLSKFLMVDMERKEKAGVFMSSFINFLSDFTVYIKNNYILKPITLLNVLLSIAISPLSNHRFIPFIYIKEGQVSELSEEQRPYYISWKHRFLKTLIFPMTQSELQKAPLTMRMEEELDKRILALAMSALLTAPTRRGNELRQIAAQTLVYRLLKQGGRSSDPLWRILSDLILDTYGFYNEQLKAHEVLYEPEVSRRGFSIRENQCEQEKIPALVCSCDKRVQELENLIFNGINCGFLLRRLSILYRKLNEDPYTKYGRIITVATGQWNYAQRKIIMDKLEGDGELVVLFTQNSLEPILIDHHLEGDNRVKYRFISETDSVVIRKVIDGLFQGNNDSTLVLAQGPSMISIPLYIIGKKNGAESLLF